MICSYTGCCTLREGAYNLQQCLEKSNAISYIQKLKLSHNYG